MSVVLRTGSGHGIRWSYRVAIWLFPAMVALFLCGEPAQAVDLARLLIDGGTIELDPANTYTLDTQFNTAAETVIIGHGATIVMRDGPLVVSESTLLLDGVIITGSGWGTLAAVGFGTLIVKDSSISCSGGSAVYIDSSNADLQYTTIQNSEYGINAVGPTHLALTQVDIHDCGNSLMQEQGNLTWNGGTVKQDNNTAIYLQQVTATFTALTVNQCGPDSIAFCLHDAFDRFLHGVVINGSKYGVIVKAGTTTIDQNSVLQSAIEDGVGVSSLDGARLVLRNSTIRGFMNGVDIQSTTPGTADIENCAFFDMTVSALCAVNAVNTRIAGSYIEDTAMDGIYFEQSTGSLVDNCLIVGARNSGVAFLNCPAGGIIQNSLVEGSAHQGIAITDGSVNVRVIGNTLIGNAICNILVDSASRAFIQGNVLTGTPDFNVRLDGTRNTKLESNLIAFSQRGVEAKNNTKPTLTLSVVGDNGMGGILAYGGSKVTVNSGYLRSNNLTDQGCYSIFVNQGARITVKASRIGPTHCNGVYNNAGAKSDVSSTYWDAADGPTVPSISEGSGAILDWNCENGSKVRYKPFRTACPLYGNWSNQLVLPAGGQLKWDTSSGATISLTPKDNCGDLYDQIAGTIRAADTSRLGGWKLPGGLIPGQVYAVWLSHGLMANSSGGSLVFRLSSGSNSVQLLRRSPTGSWIAVPANWNLSTGTLTYSPDDLHNLQGTFALIQ